VTCRVINLPFCRYLYVSFDEEPTRVLSREYAATVKNGIGKNNG
jgi:hypothetical protein